MLDRGMMQQLTDVFAKLEGTVGLVYDQSSHEKQDELIQMLEQIAQTSNHIDAVPSGIESHIPRFSLTHKENNVGVAFEGIPGGHEFTSLVLAILNVDHKGKLPDQAFIDRIRRLKGPISLRTYISLSCENCPDVVQALNLFSIFHPQLSHTMTDGAFAQEEIERLGIQGVPSVMVGDKLLSAGKASMVDLLDKLEEQFGSEERSAEPVDLGLYDVAVLGGGPAGVSAAIYSSRKGLKTVLVAERLGGQVQDTKGIENLISVPYIEGPQLSAHLTSHLAEYEIQVLEHRRVTEVGEGDLTQVSLDSGETLNTKSLIVATGAKWRELGVPGEKEYIGAGVAFCPHCDGPYYKGKDVAVIGGGNSGVEAAIDLAGIVKSVTLVEFLPELKADQVLVDKLLSLDNVKVLKNSRTAEILGNGAKVTGFTLEDRSSDELMNMDLDGVFVQIGLVPNSEFIKGLVETNAYGEIVIDDKCRTSAPGIYAAGDVTTVPYKQIVISMGEGAKAALASFEDRMKA